MSDDHSKKHQDGFTVDLNDPGEVSYFVSVLKKEFPGKSESAIKTAIHAAAAQMGSSRSREKLTEHARQLLGK